MAIGGTVLPTVLRLFAFFLPRGVKAKLGPVKITVKAEDVWEAIALLPPFDLDKERSALQLLQERYPQADPEALRAVLRAACEERKHQAISRGDRGPA